MIKDQAFVELALRKNALDPERLRQAMETRKELANFGIRKFVGGVLVEKNLASKEAVRELVEELGAFWVRCPTCKEPRCLGECDRHGDLKCAGCEKSIEYPDGRIAEDDLAISIATKGARRRGETAKAAAPPRQELGHGGRAPAAEAARESRSGDTPRKPVRPAKAAAVDSDAWFQPEPGLREITKFKPQRLIGTSAAGRLYAVSSAEFGALKVLDRFLCHDKVRIKEWVEYMQLAQDLPAAATPRPSQLFREGAVTYIVRPFTGKPEDSLRVKLGTGPLESTEAELPAALFAELLETLLAFHAAHLVHGNLKPENVVFSEGKACLTDPGFHILFQGLPREERIIALWETARYVAPEILRGGEPTTESDIYAAGRIGEDLLATASPGSVDAEALGRIIARMIHEDPVQRYPSAKEALRDLRATSSPQSARPTAQHPRRRRHGRLFRSGGGRPGKRWVLGGHAALALVLLALAGQTVAWYSTRKAMASPERGADLAARFLAEEITELESAAKLTPAAAGEIEEQWKDLAETFRGTPEEARVSEAARAHLKGFDEERTRTLAAVIARAEAHATRKEWPEALSALLTIEAREVAAGRARALIDRVAEGLHEDLGLVYIPARATENGKKATPAFLADAGLLAVASRDPAVRKEPAAEGNATAPAAGITFTEAQEFARASGKRLPRGAEWDRLAEIIERPRGLEVLAAKRLRDVKGSLYQWVEDEAEDDLGRAGYGWLRGGDRPGVPPTHPVRRKKTAAHPDVGARLVRDLPAAGAGK